MRKAANLVLGIPVRWIGPLFLLLLAYTPSPLHAQTTTGSVLGRAVDRQTQSPIVGAEVRIPSYRLATVTDSAGRFVLIAVPPGEHVIEVTALGYARESARVTVGAGRSTPLALEMEPAAIAVEGIEARAERVRLVEPDFSATHEIVDARELRELPIDAISDAIELAPGVSDGHFRGGRIGQEVYVIDGLEVKNQLEGSSQGPGIEFSPFALQEVEVVTGGFGAAHGSALSGVVKLVSRRGDPTNWEGRASVVTDHWAPTSLFRGYTGVAASIGGPVRPLGSGSTLFLDIYGVGSLDSDPRARGLTCLRAADADAELAARIDDMTSQAREAPLHCPFTAEMFPHQQGDKLIGFARFDRPIASGATFTASVLANRNQGLLYTPEFKYNPRYQLGQRTNSVLGQLSTDLTKHVRGRAFHLVARGAAMRLDRHLGAMSVSDVRARSTLAGFGLGGYRFLGEDFVHQPIEQQLAAGTAVPEYIAPGGSRGSPFGFAGAGIFYTEGTPHVANWSRMDLLGADLAGELLSARGHQIQGGVSVKFYDVQMYERTQAHLAASANDAGAEQFPNFQSFSPATLSTYAEARLAAADEVTVFFGGRIEAFRSGLEFDPESDTLATVVSTEWKTSFLPRIGVALPVPGTAGRTAFRFNYGRVAQPPDFRFFLDTTIGDSLRTDIRRQGNPNLSFERGAAYEAALSQMFGEHIGVSLTGFRKELTNLVTGSLSFSGYAPGQFTTGDFGSVHGVEVSSRARWPRLQARFGYAWQKAQGVASTALDDTLSTEETRIEFPLPFDRRHAVDFALFVGQAAGLEVSRWSLSLIGSAKSGIPLDRRIAGGEIDPERPATRPTYLPWTAIVDARGAYEFARSFLCRMCRWNAVVDARNLLGRENIIGLRRETGLVAPSLQEVQRLVGNTEAFEPIPRESPAYSEPVDLDGDGLVTASEYARVRFAAALDRFDPSLFYGEARQVRLGVEISF